VRFALEEAASSLEGRPLLARITLAGSTALHAGFTAEPEAVAAECGNAAFAIGPDIHLERVVLQTRLPASAGAGPGAELHEVFARGLDDADLVQKLLADFAKLRQELPFIPGRPPAVLPKTAEDLRALMPEAWILAEKVLGADDPP
jgi:hypothetical protein